MINSKDYNAKHKKLKLNLRYYHMRETPSNFKFEV